MGVFIGVGILIGMLVSIPFAPKLRDARQQLRDLPKGAPRWAPVRIILVDNFRFNVVLLIGSAVGAVAGFIVWGVWQLVTTVVG